MKKLLPVVIACLALTSQAFASTSSQKASRKGADENGNSCFFSYQITKEAPSAVNAKHDIVYKVRLDNLGSCDLRDVDLADHLSRHVKFLDATPGFILHDDRIVWKDLKIEENRSLRFFIKVTPDTHHDVETVYNTASSFAPQVGQRISATVGATVYKH